MKSILKIEKISVYFGDKQVVKNISFQLKQQQILGVVGESGSGKSVTFLAVLKLLSKKATFEGTVIFENQNLSEMSEKELQKIRGNQISMIFQEPMSSLNPSLTCGFQVAEILKTHKNRSNKTAKKEVIALFNKVKLPRADEIFNQYPHQISGGQQQRVMIAMAIACKPTILIADEPTTALDVTVQKEIIDLLKDLQQETKMSIVFISHDLSLVSEIADDVLVMYKGEIVEQGNAQQIFKNPTHNYTKALINSKPSLTHRVKKLPTVSDFMSENIDFEEYTTVQREKFHQKIYSKKPLLEIKNLATYFNTEKKFIFQKENIVKAVDDVSFNVYEGETLGLVGESGCGKTTLGRTILHLEKATKGAIYYKQNDITTLSKNKLKDLRKEVQIIFQDPFSSLNPRIPVGQAIMEPMKVHGIFKSNKECEAEALKILEKVGLSKEHFYKYPHEFSGGQRQRIGIARTIGLRPKLIICDESVSALDVSVQAQVLNLLNALKEEFGFTYIFISHDLAVVKYMSDQLVVMNQGKIEEIGDADAIYKNPQSSYTKKLIEAIPKGI
ncbi:ABC transporter ATP-binding protein [Lutibacter sp.]|uniref:ABC transporter ATP-binding protein n=1 Tax=Lutibacter sp. TaxID=1925666 RepID=UPI0025C67EE8|nr:ABC transporter ATP-binding protein [Lutibacter sp.]MCF6182647.1 ABC transporter ATP-binding protein [Lutibacter sp.]